MPPFNFQTTHIGSVPHLSAEALTRRLVETLDIPAWPQLPKRSFYESMYVQYSPALPGLVVDHGREKVYFDTAQDLTPHLESFYTAYLDDDVEYFALLSDYAHGFFSMLDVLHQTDGTWAKGQVTGPVSFGLTVTDQDLRASLYNDLLVDTIVKNVAMCARWQIRQLKKHRPNVIVFLDEPYMASFGSAFISLSQDQVITMLNEVFDAIHSEGAIAGVHCCANTDWSVLLKTNVDILNLDAYGYIENLALYPSEIRSFLDREGSIAWGIIPNNENIFSETPETLANRLLGGYAHIAEKAESRGVAILAEEFLSHSLITPACGLGSAPLEIAEAVFSVLEDTAARLRT